MKLTYALIMNLLLTLTSFPSLAETLIEFEGGSQSESESHLTKGEVLIYIERDCGVCHRYVKTLDGCSESVKKKIKLVSVSTPAQTKDMARKLSTDLPLYLLKPASSGEAVEATPTTRTARSKKIGKMSCAELEALLKEVPQE